MTAPPKKLIIAIDGPVGSGKSTLARRVAEMLGYVYVDTGAMYRALALKAVRHKISLDAADALGALAHDTRIDLRAEEGGQRVFLDGEDVTMEIRTPEMCIRDRAYIENGMQTLPGNAKLYYMGPMFRRERPQKGRYRQFYQIGAEVLGQSDAPAIDAEVLEMLVMFFKRVGLTRTTLYINSIGCKECRPQYVELLREKLREVKDQLGPDSQRRIETNPLRVLDSKLPQEQPIIAKLPRIFDHLCTECREHFTKLKEELGLRGIVYEENWRLVRGLDYYTRTTFEVTAEGLGLSLIHI